MEKKIGKNVIGWALGAAYDILRGEMHDGNIVQ